MGSVNCDYSSETSFKCHMVEKINQGCDIILNSFHFPKRNKHAVMMITDNGKLRAGGFTLSPLESSDIIYHYRKMWLTECSWLNDRDRKNRSTFHAAFSFSFSPLFFIVSPQWDYVQIEKHRENLNFSKYIIISMASSRLANWTEISFYLVGYSAWLLLIYLFIIIVIVYSHRCNSPTHRSIVSGDVVFAERSIYRYISIGTLRRLIVSSRS